MSVPVNPDTSTDAFYRPAVPLGHTGFTWGREQSDSGKQHVTIVGQTPAAAGSKKAAKAAAARAAKVKNVDDNASAGAVAVNVRALTPTGIQMPVAGERNILITSALPYVNNVPHLGNIIGCVLSADVYARFCRNRGYNTLYICGTDEYGTATETKAQEENLSPKEICDKYHAIHRDIYSWFDIAFDHFGRTSTKQQTEICHDIFHKLDNAKWVVPDIVEQLYCTKCSKFLADRFVEGTCPDKNCAYIDARGDQCDKCGKLVNAVELVNPRCKTCGSVPEKRTSPHLFLDLEQLTPQLESWFRDSSVKGEWSDNAITITNAWIKNGLQKRCITRDLKWGVQVPKEGYENKVFYVWFDAPIGYLSITAHYSQDWEKWWKNPKDVELVQFMGKDNVPFHCVIFPSCLIGANDNYTLLHKISATEYLQYEGSKFSKSRGTGVFGDNAQSTGIPSEVWRYYMLYNRPENADTVFLWEDFAAKNNSELLNNLGNFINRTLAFVKNSYGGTVPAIDSALTAEDNTCIADVNTLITEYIAALEKVSIKEGLKLAMAVSSRCNRYMQDNKPWELFKKDRARADTVVNVSVNLIYLLNILIEPYMPSITDKISTQLNVTFPVKVLKGAYQMEFNIKGGHVIGTPAHLFRLIDDTEIASLRLRFGGEAVQKTGAEFPMDLCIGTVTEVTEHSGAPHLYVVKVDVGEEQPRTIVTGIKSHYAVPQQLVGKSIVVLLNIKASNFKGVRSEAFIPTGVVGTKLGVLVPSAGAAPIAAGTRISPVTCNVVPKKNFDIKNDLKKVDLVTRDDTGVVVFGDCKLTVANQESIEITAENVGSGAKIQ